MNAAPVFLMRFQDKLRTEDNEVDVELDEEGGPCRTLTAYLLDKMTMFVHSSDLEVQDRAVSIHQLLRYVLKMIDKEVACAAEVAALFAGELNPVAKNAQKKVPIPEG